MPDLTDSGQKVKFAAEDLLIKYREIRRRTEEIAQPLNFEDQVVQPVTYVSPAKWHLAHTTWFFENFILQKFAGDYRVFNERYGYLFNSYYESVGDRVLRSQRGLMTRPPVADILEYRSYVDVHIKELLTAADIDPEVLGLLEIGLQHEMQHGELMMTDIKYILGHQPFFPVYKSGETSDRVKPKENKLSWVNMPEGIYEIGAESGSGFRFDNEFGLHKQYLQPYQIASRPVLFGEFIEFIEDGGYRDFNHWHSDAWAWVEENEIEMPMYMHRVDGEYKRYALGGEMAIDPGEVLVHISFYEAAAYASWKGMRLPTEFEWEAASDRFDYGDCWEWTGSAYLPYPGYHKAPGALGEYNGKFMVNQMVLRGASRATPPSQKRSTYRNFFHPYLQWQLSGLRLVR